jgi:predicted RNA-binding Zn-ribbon protein involved in translation (DUF1610 family)
MTMVRALCPDCGEIIFDLNDLAILDEFGKEAVLVYKCPTCHQEIRKTVNDRVLAAVLQAKAADKGAPASWLSRSPINPRYL